MAPPAPIIRPGSKVVVALGGNALVRPGETATVGTQARNVHEAMTALLPLIRSDCRMVVTHGNGFQVGNILIRVEESLGKAYPIPLELCVAESQGELGYMIEQTLQNVLVEHHLRSRVVSVLTQVVVDEADPAFDHPTKPVGPYFTASEAEALEREGFHVAEEPGRGWRKVVASPRPLEIDDVEVLLWLMRKRVIVIAAGGGGVPVVRTTQNTLRGVPAVIDKDLASAVLAHAIGARHLVILTGESCVYLDYRQPSQSPLRALTVAEAGRYLEAGHFPAGSMGPKVEAGIRFLEGGGSSVLITSSRELQGALRGETGTVMTRRKRRSAA